MVVKINIKDKKKSKNWSKLFATGQNYLSKLAGGQIV
jgi:hypothetical protein